MLYVQERASIGARYHVAIFPEFVPRLWAINSGRTEGGRNETPGHWFAEQDRLGSPCIALKHLAEGDEEWLRGVNADSHDRAQARRIIIFEVKDIYEASAEGSATDRTRRQIHEDGLERATPLPSEIE